MAEMRQRKATDEKEDGGDVLDVWFVSLSLSCSSKECLFCSGDGRLTKKILREGNGEV